MRKISIRILMIAILIGAINSHVKAQGGPTDPCEPGDPNCPDPDQIPLDPGSWVLVAAGVGYGIKKWRDAKQENKKTNPNITAAFMQENKIDENHL